ncbi:unnamed protein product [Rotaria socialis]|uniref:DNA polymerase n=1 Tax=Rotaria socialis TaxID=392032 RepID=A0A817TDC1_9BILA|nr:unnamed protein product [Rotaria socialis]CAF3434830.1 unnamed protein product [Rotaria socialis]CAF4227687.1 unnamed protein product [Rotaria socialis]
MISVRIVLTDHYLTSVNSQFDPVYSKLRHPIKQVPIIRIFGPNEAGKKVCLHVHGVFPYLLVKSPTDEIRYGEQLAQSLDMAINLSFEKGNIETKHVHDIKLVELLPIYGYHDKMVKFWKIEFYNPAIIRKASDLLLAGAVMNQEFQPHEAHVPFNLQFFIDYNLYGMNFILFNNAAERQLSNMTTNLSAATNQTTNISSIQRVSSCKLEYDVHIDDICKGIANPGLQALWNGERTRREHLKIIDRLTPPTSPERPHANPFVAETRHQEKLKANIQKRPPPTDEVLESSPPVNLDDTTIDLARIERVNSMSQEIDDEVLVQMMVNDEISDSQGIENDSILAADVKQLDDEELLDNDVEKTVVNTSILTSDIESDTLSVLSPTLTITNSEPSSQTSEQERDEMKKYLQEFFEASTNKNVPISSKYCWLETTNRPPVRKRTTNLLHRKISTQIICQDIEDETSFVKLFSNIPEFISKHHQHTNEAIIDINPGQGAQWYQPLQPPPHSEQYRIPMSKSLKKENISKKSRTNLLHKESFCMNRNDNCADKVKQTDIIHECQYLTIVSFEIFCHTNETYAFALDTDEICSLFCTKAYETTNGWKIQSYVLISNSLLRIKNSNILTKSFRSLENKTIESVKNELELIERFCEIMQQSDPDMIVCYDMKLSLYYLIKRAKLKYKLDLLMKLSRIPEPQDNTTRSRSHMTANGDDLPVIIGRVVLDLWRILRSEITLNIYTFENAMYHVLHERVPHYDISLISKWLIDEGFNPSFGLRDFVSLLDYGWMHSVGNFRLMHELDLINKTSEFARIYGIEFYHVLSRGSQYRVESMMIRLAKCSDYVTVTPDNKQRLHMRAPECIALTLEPISNIYFTPIAVLDFQSLYPSIVMAYNICYSTCLGRVDQLDKQGPFKFGCTSLKIPDRILSTLNPDKDIFCSPNGVAFVKRHIRRGILSVMLEEILATRVMVKNTMKLVDKKSALYKTLDARQLCLKLIANVTFGYTSASFSGRMPCVEIGDTIVYTARTVLERAIDFIKTNPHFGGRVVYGDTDSLFIQFPHSTRAQAFDQSHLLVKALNQLYPSPIKIKFEKIYLQSVLASKKRYVGLSYETVDQQQGKFDAKGIETIRRDTCFMVSKILQQSLKLLFQTKDVTRVRRYVQSECEKILSNRFNLLDFIFAKEYRGKERYHPAAPVPALRIALERAKTNPLAEPNKGERVPYVIGFNSESLNANLIDCVWTLDRVFKYKSQFKLNSMYYIKKQILPALDRCLALIGVNVFKWIDKLSIDMNSNEKQPGQILLDGTNLRRRCFICSQLTNAPLCNECRHEEDLSEIMIICENKANKFERQHANLQRLCFACSDRIDGWSQCSTIDCPIRFGLHKTTQLMQNAQETRMFVYNEC